MLILENYMAVASSSFSSLVDVEVILSILHFLSTHIEFSEMEHWPHVEHMCGFQHFAHFCP